MEEPQSQPQITYSKGEKEGSDYILDKQKAIVFHHNVIKPLFLCNMFV